MSRKLIGPRWVALVVVVVAGGTFAGGVVAAQFRAAATPEELEAALRNDPLVRVAEIPAEHGLAGRGVFVQPTSAGFLCLWDAPSANTLARQGGCNLADDPLAGRQLFVSLAYDGGPAVADIEDARVIGLASADVEAVQLLMSDRTRRDLPMKRSPAISGAAGTFRAFGYRIRTSDLKRGIGPVAVLAFDFRGKEIDRQPTGFAE
jgi:hypothetical protein